MRLRTFSDTPGHQLVLSLTPESLHLLHLQRSALGWRRVHQEQRPLPAGDTFLAELQTQLQQCVQQWRLPPLTRAHWVLAGDILGLTAPAQPGTPASALLPFAAADIRSQPDLFARSEHPALLWIHRDWLAEIERISEQCGLQLVELYARAQLLQREAARAGSALTVVLEPASAPTAEPASAPPPGLLHIYGPGGALLRSRVLEGSERSSALADVLQAELAALPGPPPHEGAPAQLLSASQPPGDWPNLRWRALAALSEGERLWRLWRSDLEGIVVRATHEELSGKLKALSVALGILGTLALGAMIWHDGQLQQQIDEDSADVRRDAPRVAAAQALKQRTLHMADSVQAFEALQQGGSALDGLALLTRQFLPPPATLLYVRAEPGALAFAGSGDEASVQALRERGLPGYGPLQDLPVPDFLADSNPAIHLQTQKLPPQPPADTAAPAAAAAPAPELQRPPAP